MRFFVPLEDDGPQQSIWLPTYDGASSFVVGQCPIRYLPMVQDTPFSPILNKVVGPRGRGRAIRVDTAGAGVCSVLVNEELFVNTPASGWTFAFWIKVEQVGTDNLPIITIGDPGVPESWIVGVTIDGKAWLRKQSLASGDDDELVAGNNGQLSDGRWHHVVWVTNYNSPVWKCYIDGASAKVQINLGANSGILTLDGSTAPTLFGGFRLGSGWLANSAELAAIGSWLQRYEIWQLYADPDCVYQTRRRPVSSIPSQTITCTGIASAEAIGAPRLQLRLLPTGIASAEAIGTPRLQLKILPTGIASAEALGTPRLQLKILPTGIASAEAVGAPRLNLRLAPTGIASAEAIGVPRLQLKILPTGISSAQALGTPSLQLRLLPTGIASAEVIGTPRLNLRIYPTGISSSEALGVPRLQLRILPAGIATAEALGTPRLQLLLRPTGIGSAEALGTPALRLFVLPVGIATAQAFGLPAVLGGAEGRVGASLTIVLAVTSLEVPLVGTGLTVALAPSSLAVPIADSSLPVGLQDAAAEIRIAPASVDAII